MCVYVCVFSSMKCEVSGALMQSALQVHSDYDEVFIGL